jgi:large subunit ribosomal protein L30
MAAKARKKIRVTQVKSGIGQPERIQATLRALGIKGHQKSAELSDDPAIRGMIAKVRHLVAVEDA